MVEKLKNIENMDNKERKLPARVYYVFSPEDKTVLLAMDVLIGGNTIHWFDTVKERIMHISKIQKEIPTEFIFERSEQEGGGMYTFSPLTLSTYTKKVKNHVLIPDEFQNEEEMFRAFEKTRGNAW